MSSTKCLFLCISFIVLGIKANLAPFIKPCTRQDSDCILKSSIIAHPYIVDGIPELGIPPTDPLQLDSVNADSGEMKLTFNNSTLTGPKQCTFIKVTRKEKGGVSTGSIILECPIKVIGEYVLDGQFVFIKAIGSGSFEVKTDKIRLEVDITLKSIKGKDGKKHYKVSGFRYKYKPIERFYIHLDNLFNGDEAQAEPLLNLLNQYWESTLDSLGKPMIEEIMKKTVHNLDLLFRAIPSEELEIA